MDSILVQDMSRQVFQGQVPMVPPMGPVPPMLISTRGPVPGLEKRPTFDNIDKRASWSVDKSHMFPPGAVSMFPAPGTLPHSLGPGNKKPIPLPRSKIPVATKSATIERSGHPPDMRTFKRSKTDLSLNMLTNYKSNRSGANSNSRPNGPINPINVSPTKKRTAQVKSQPSQYRTNRPSVIAEESARTVINEESKQSESHSDKNIFNKFKINKVTSSNKNKSNSGVASKKPVLREKPSLVSSSPSDMFSDKRSNLSRHRSESDLLRIEPRSEFVQPSDLFRTDFPAVREETTNDVRINVATDTIVNNKSSRERLIVHDEEDLPSMTSSINIKESPVRKNIRKETNEKFLDMDDTLPEPPPTPPEAKKLDSPDISKPLTISTEPMSVSTSSNNRSEDKSNCSSYDSLDGSLDSGVSQEWPEGGDWLGQEPTRDTLKSPNTSTCSRAPPTPPPDTCPVRRVIQVMEIIIRM